MYFYNHDPDPVNHDLDVAGDDDNEDDDNDGDTHDHAQDDNQYSGDDRHQDLAVNALTLQPPSPLPNSHTSFISKNVKVLCTTGPKFRKNSARVDFATCQDELKPKFLAKI